MLQTSLTSTERLIGGFTDRFQLSTADFTAASGAQAITLCALAPGQKVGRIAVIAYPSAAVPGTPIAPTLFENAGDTTFNSVGLAVGDNESATQFLSSTQLAALNGIVFNDGVTASSTTVTSATAAFTSADIGQSISGGSIPSGATITAVGSSTSVTISAAASASATGVSLTIGGRTTTATAAAAGTAVKAYNAVDALIATFTPLSGKVLGNLTTGAVTILAEIVNLPSLA